MYAQEHVTPDLHIHRLSSDLADYKQAATA